MVKLLEITEPRVDLWYSTRGSFFSNNTLKVLKKQKLFLQTLECVILLHNQNEKCIRHLTIDCNKDLIFDRFYHHHFRETCKFSANLHPTSIIDNVGDKTVFRWQIWDTWYLFVSLDASILFLWCNNLEEETFVDFAFASTDGYT